jgi:hypothetical protein
MSLRASVRVAISLVSIVVLLTALTRLPAISEAQATAVATSVRSFRIPEMILRLWRPWPSRARFFKEVLPHSEGGDGGFVMSWRRLLRSVSTPSTSVM